MCQRYDHRRSDYTKEEYESIKFYKHFRTYLIVNAILFFTAVSGNNDFEFWPVTLFWGIGVISHYKKVFGRYPFEDLYNEEEEPIREVNKSRRKKKWRDKDLV
ncbi:MAG: 2TM domain-containing protein [Bacteroidota bacterium]